MLFTESVYAYIQRMKLEMLNGLPQEERVDGVACSTCQAVTPYDNSDDEMTFYLGDTVVEVSEQYPDWDRAVCFNCSAKDDLELAMQTAQNKLIALHELRPDFHHPADWALAHQELLACIARITRIQQELEID